MSLISRAIPGLFGGVSQQIPAMRHPTQCEVQDNGLSTVVQGLFKRPGSVHMAQLPPSWAPTASASAVGNVHVHAIDRGAGKRWKVYLDGASLSVVNMETGAVEPVVSKDLGGSAVPFPAYLQAADPANSFRCITVADTTFMVNMGVTVRPSNLDSDAPASDAFLYVRTGVPQHTYYVTVQGSTASYTAPASGVTTDTVVSGIVAAINALGGGRSALALDLARGLIRVSVASTPNPTVTATDTYGNTTMVVVSNGVRRFSDLPPSYPSGAPRVKILGESASADVDPYYVQWDGRAWTECRAYGVDTNIQSLTMPHKLYKQDGTWVIQPIDWKPRLVGDDNTNPMPSFVGRTLRDIFFYRNRLGFLAGDSLVLSRAGDYYNFFASTATQVLDNDPIDLGGTAESVDTLDWAVPFNQKLIVWASNKQQFVLEGGDVMTPAAARLVPVTAFETNNTARPRPLGNRIVFPSSINGYTQLSLYRVSMDTVSNTAEVITEQTPTYIPVAPRSLELSETAKLLCVVPAVSNALYIFKYEDDGDKLTQKAWQRFTFTGEVVKAHWAGQRLYLTVLYRGAAADGGHRLCLEYIDFSRDAADPALSFGMRLDRRVFVNGATATGNPGEYQFTATLPDSAGLKVYRFTGTTDPVELVVVSKVVNAGAPTTVTFTVQAPAGTGTFVVGQPYKFLYTFTEVFMRDGEGVPVMDARLKLLKMMVRFVRTGFFKTRVETKARGVFEYDSYAYSVDGLGVGNLDQLLGKVAISDGDYAIPVHAQAAGTRVSLESESPLPCCFPYAEWRGSLNMKSQR